MQYDGYITFGKKHEPEKMARGGELEYLPFGMGGEQGPSAWRDTGLNPSDRYAASKAKSNVVRALIQESRKPWWQRGSSRKRMEKLMYQYDLASGVENNGSQ